MTYEPPTPPSDLPKDVIDILDEYSPERLRHVARYAEALAESKERERQRDDESERDRTDSLSDDVPEGVPPKATLTIKEINDNRYYYWQWREGDKVTSKYKGPVNPES